MCVNEEARHYYDSGQHDLLKLVRTVQGKASSKVPTGSTCGLIRRHSNMIIISRKAKLHHHYKCFLLFFLNHI